MKKTQYEIIQKKLDKKATLILKGTVKNHKSARTFILAFIKDYNMKYDTLYLKSRRLQTQKQSSRSIGDIYRITKHYFPYITLYQVYSILYSFDSLVGHYCGDINCQVYSIREVRPSWNFYILDYNINPSSYRNILRLRHHDENNINLVNIIKKNKLKYFKR